MLRNVHILPNLVKLEGKNRHAVITNASTSNGVKIQTFFLVKVRGMMLYLSIAPFKLNVVSVLINKCTLYTYIFFHPCNSVANKIKGIQFTLRGASSGSDLGRYFCQNHLHGNDTTQFYAVQRYVNQVSAGQVSFGQGSWFMTRAMLMKLFYLYW